MYNIDAANDFFPYHEDYEQLSSISYTTTYHPKVKYVVLGAFEMTIDAFFVERLLHSDFLNSHRGGVKQILVTKNIILKSLVLKTRCSDTKISGIMQRSNQFVVLGPGVYDGRINVGANIA